MGDPPLRRAARSRRPGRSLLGLALILAASCGGEDDAETAVEEDEPKRDVEALVPVPFVSEGDFLEGTRRYLDSEIGFSVQIPTGWTRRDEGLGSLLLFASESAPRSSLGLSLRPQSGGTIDRYLTTSIAHLRSTCPGWRLLAASEHFTAQGDRGYELDYEWLAQGARVRQRQILLLGRDFEFALTGTYGEAVPAEGEADELADCLHSFVLLSHAR